jgi:hypothetical protein
VTFTCFSVFQKPIKKIVVCSYFWLFSWKRQLRSKNKHGLRIDVVPSRGVVEPLLEWSIVATLLKFLILVWDKSEILSEHHLLLIRIWKSKSVLSDYWNSDKYWEYSLSLEILRVVVFPWNTESIRYLFKTKCSERLLNHRKILKESSILLKTKRAKRHARGLTATEGGQITSYCNIHGLTAIEGNQAASLYIAHGTTTTEAGQTASTSNGWNLKLKVVISSMAVYPWIELRSDHQVRINFPTASFLSVGYKYPSISCKISLSDIWTTYLTLESPLPSHISLSWSIVDLWDFSDWFEWFELCGTSDSSSQCHWLVTLGGCHLLDGLEEWKQWVIQEDCEGGLVFLWKVLCSPRRSGEEKL